MKRLLIVLLFVLSITGLSHAATTANILRDNCRESMRFNSDPASMSALQVWQSGMCGGYISGWLEGVIGLSILDNKTGKPQQIVGDESATIGQVIRVFVKYVNEHPEFENQPADRIITQALVNAHLLSLRPIKATLMPTEN